jgi:hypothetical protein
LDLRRCFSLVLRLRRDRQCFARGGSKSCGADCWDGWEEESIVLLRRRSACAFRLVVLVVADNGKEVEERVGRVAVMARKRLERVLAVEEDDGVAPGAEEVLGGRGTTSAGGEVVEEPHTYGGKLSASKNKIVRSYDIHVVFERDRRSAALMTKEKLRRR